MNFTFFTYYYSMFIISYPIMQSGILNIVPFPIRIIFTLALNTHFLFKIFRMALAKERILFTKTMNSKHRMIFSRNMFTMINPKTLLRTKFPLSFFNIRRFSFEFFITYQTIFNHFYLQSKRLFSACSEVTVMLLTHTQSRMLAIKNLLPLNNISITYI